MTPILSSLSAAFAAEMAANVASPPHKAAKPARQAEPARM